MITKAFLLSLGFVQRNHETVADSFRYNIGLNRFISIGCLNSPEQELYLLRVDENDKRKAKDLIILHSINIDSRVLTKERLVNIINVLKL